MKCPQCAASHPISAVAPEGLVCAGCGSLLEPNIAWDAAVREVESRTMRRDAPHEPGTPATIGAPSAGATSVAETPDVGASWLPALVSIMTLAAGQYGYFLAFQNQSRPSLMVASVLTVAAIGIALFFGAWGSSSQAATAVAPAPQRTPLATGQRRVPPRARRRKQRELPVAR